MRQVIRAASGGWQYPFLNSFILTSTPVEASEEGIGTIDQIEVWSGCWKSGDSPSARPTLRWVNDGNIVDLYAFSAEGVQMHTEEFLQEQGLSLSMSKGEFVLSKRISRVMRPYAMSAFLGVDKITVVVDNDLDSKSFDGAMLIDENFVRSMMPSVHALAGMPLYKRNRWLRELAETNRFEVTVMTSEGQLKGHAIVVRDLRHNGANVDIIAPSDVKTDVRLNGRVFVGLNAVHSRDDMRLDVQSVVNLHEFFGEEYLGECLLDNGQFYVDAIHDGTVAMQMARQAKFTDWWLPEYFARGGKVEYFPGIIRMVVNQHITSLSNTNLEKMRLPIHGGRYYVMSDVVGAAAGIIPVAAGHARLDRQHATVWVNDGDWKQFISAILGGADQDDALWVHPFQQDGVEQLLLWRSPNQHGEWVVLKADAASGIIPYCGNEAPASRQANITLLGLRIDQQEINYLGLVTKATRNTTNIPYTIEQMDVAIAGERRNAGVLGSMCNMLMLLKAMYGSVEGDLPAPLEDIIDASVKTGDDLSAVRQWISELRSSIILTNQAIPRTLALRMGRSEMVQESIQSLLVDDTPIDRLRQVIVEHIALMEGVRDEMSLNAAIPLEVVMLAGGEEIGNRARQLYARILGNSTQTMDVNMAQASEQCLHYVQNQEYVSPAEVMACIMHACYTSKDIRKDGVVWQDSLLPHVFDALEELGVIGAAIEGKNGVTYTQPGTVETVRMVGINYVWFNLAKVDGRISAAMPRDVAPATAKRLKNDVPQMLRPYLNIPLQVVDEGGRQIVKHGNITMGYVPAEQRVDMKSVTIIDYVERDGNITAFCTGG